MVDSELDKHDTWSLDSDSFFRDMFVLVNAYVKSVIMAVHERQV
jgi:hypothetical protein